MKKQLLATIAAAVSILALGTLVSCMFRKCPVYPIDNSGVPYATNGGGPYVLLHDDPRDEGAYLNKFENLEPVENWLASNNTRFWTPQFFPSANGEATLIFYEKEGQTIVYFYDYTGKVKINKAGCWPEYTRGMTEQDHEFVKHLLAPNGKTFAGQE